MTDKIANRINSNNPNEIPHEHIHDYRNALCNYTAQKDSIFTESRLKEAKQHLRTFINSGHHFEKKIQQTEKS